MGAAGVEGALAGTEAGTAAAAIGLPHDSKRHAIHACVSRRAGVSGNSPLESELNEHVGREMGPIAKPESIEFVDMLPKTRSGKIMRRV